MPFLVLCILSENLGTNIIAPLNKSQERNNICTIDYCSKDAIIFFFYNSSMVSIKCYISYRFTIIMIQKFYTLLITISIFLVSLTYFTHPPTNLPPLRNSPFVLYS